MPNAAKDVQLTIKVALPSTTVKGALDFAPELVTVIELAAASKYEGRPAPVVRSCTVAR